MNYIESNLYNNSDLDTALNLFLPDSIPIELASSYKEHMLRLMGPDNIIIKANMTVVQYNILKYLDFFLKMSELSEEKCSVITIDSTTIFEAKQLLNYENKPREILDFVIKIFNGVNTSGWLVMKNIKNEFLSNYLKYNYELSTKIVDGNDIYIQLIPANTTIHLDELYRAFCAYL